MRIVLASLLLGSVVASSSCGGDEAAGESSQSATAGPGATGGPATTGSSTGAGGGAGTGTGAGGAGGGGGSAPTVCEGNCRYVRAGAAGDGSGSDWVNAFPQILPAALERGSIYLVAAGAYAAHGFGDDPDGTSPIRVLRATDADHATDVGWDPGYAAGEAVFGPLTFDTPLYDFDGRGATRVVGAFQGTVVEIGGADVSFRGCDVDGNFQLSGGQHTDGACTGLDVHADRVVVAHNRIHDAADDGVSITGATQVSFAGNVVHALHGCGTDGGCGPCYNGHSDGLEIYALKDSELVGNLIYDVASTAAIFFGNWADELGAGPADYCQNILLANNLLYSPETGFVAYIEDAAGVNAYNNVFWGAHQGAYGGLSIGENVAGLQLYNNAILSINYTHIGGSYDPAEHHGDYNLFGTSLGQWQDQAHDVVAPDAGFAGIADIDGAPVANPEPADFTPMPGSPLIGAGFGGDANILIPATDFFGAPRGAPPNIGAIE